MIWSEFERAAPELARHGRERIERFDCVMVGTVRRDGGPRVNPVEAYIVDGHLLLNMMPRSLKALDLLRDPRIFVHSLITSRAGDEGEFKLQGHAVVLADERLRTELDDLFERRIDWRPPPDSHYFDVRAESAAFVRYVDGAQQLDKWSRGAP